MVRHRQLHPTTSTRAALARLCDIHRQQGPSTSALHTTPPTKHQNHDLPALSTQHSALSTQHSALSSDHSVTEVRSLKERHNVLFANVCLPPSACTAPCPRTDILISAADFTDTLTLVINEDQPDRKATFTVPETLLTEKSEFFKAACRNEWREVSSRIVKIPEVDGDAFNAYLNWVYRDRVAVGYHHPLAGRSYTAFESNFALHDLIQLCLLADRFVDVQLRNLTVNAILCVLGRVYGDDEDWSAAITPDMIALVWSSTTAKRALRRLIVDFYAQYVKAERLERARDELHPEFVKDLMMEVFRMKDKRKHINFFLRSVCYYHEHDEYDEDPRCKRDVFRLE